MTTRQTKQTEPTELTDDEMDVSGGRITFSDLIVSSYQSGGSHGDVGKPQTTAELKVPGAH